MHPINVSCSCCVYSWRCCMVLPTPLGWGGKRRGVRAASISLGSASPFPHLPVEASPALRMRSLSASPHSSHSAVTSVWEDWEGQRGASQSFVLAQASALLERMLGSETGVLTSGPRTFSGSMCGLKQGTPPHGASVLYL